MGGSPRATVDAPVESPPSALAEPSFYPHAPGRVTVHETHISWVFLAGERAYKLKKPIRLGFLDYSTPVRRRRMCQQEVRLNRRLAPALYLGVRAIAKGEEGLVLAPEEDPRAVDYLVEMRRYDEDSTLAASLARGELRCAEMAVVGRVLARFHERAQRVRARVNAAELRRVVSENCRELMDLAEHRAEPERVLALERFLLAFLAAHADTLDRRAGRGLVREGHGDLRAEHVLLDGEVQIVDCVEFDKRLRDVDVADDLSFLVMDLAHRGGGRYAQALVDGYRAAGGDPGEENLLAFYASHRALVRAKVELLEAGQVPPGSSGRGRHEAEARELIALAQRFAWRARTPLVIVVCGVPAAGKSQLAGALAAASGLAHLNSDIVRKQLAGLGPGGRGSSALYTEEWNRRTYRELGGQAASELARHGGAVVDATFRHRADRDAFTSAFAHAAPAVFVECVAPASVLARRAAGRARQPGNASDASPAVVERERLAWEPLGEIDAGDHLLVRSDRSLDAIIADVCALLDLRMARLGARASGARDGGGGRCDSDSGGAGGQQG